MPDNIEIAKKGIPTNKSTFFRVGGILIKLNNFGLIRPITKSTNKTNDKTESNEDIIFRLNG